jgi:PST family polysaccharide transporter
VNIDSATNHLPPLGGVGGSPDSKSVEFDRRFGATALGTDLKGKTVRAGAFTFSSQVARFLVYTISSVVLGRLLSPRDYGLVGMVIAVTGFLRVCNYAGLSTATVQRTTITHELVSAIFWINIALAIGLTALSTLLAPALALFYREPQLYWITVAMAVTFLLDACSAQHLALLQRQMRFKAVAVIDLASLSVGVVLSILAALAGMGYWSLVLLQTASGFVSLLAAWLVEPWRPGPPRRTTGVRSVLRFGGYLTGVSLLTYVFRNIDNVLIGWRWGPGPLGFYQKAYSLLMLPIEQVNSPISSVATSSLSRLNDQPERQRRYFVGAYALSSSITVPVIITSAIFAGDVIPFLLGKQWIPSVIIFQLLVPATLVGALLAPLFWLFVATGRTDRQFKLTVVWTTLILLAFLAGLRYGPKGVSIGFSAMSLVLAIPVSLYATNGTAVRITDLAQALKYPVLAISVPAFLGVLFRVNALAWAPMSFRAIVGPALVLLAYAFVLLLVLRQWNAYRDLLLHMVPSRKGR